MESLNEIQKMRKSDYKVGFSMLNIILVCAIFFFTNNSEAQFWNKLGKKVTDAAERALDRKVEEKTERETEKAFDSVFNNQGKIFKSEKETPPEGYVFTHTYKMDLIMGDDTLPITYYMTNYGEYLGTSVQMEDGPEMITVMDAQKKTAFSFMDLNGSKTMVAMPLVFEDMVDESMEDQGPQITETGRTKQILGYACKEYEVLGKDFECAVWITQDADISFSDAFANIKSTKKGKGANQQLLFLAQGLTLEVDMTDTSKKKAKPMKMVCTEFLKQDFIIQTAQYKKSF